MQFIRPSQSDRNKTSESRGPVLVDYQCPSCHTISLAPLRKVANGPVGYWCCEACDSAFRVRVELDAIPQASNTGIRTDVSPAPLSRELLDDAPALSPQRMLELHGEALYLRSRLVDGKEAIETLRETPTE